MPYLGNEQRTMAEKRKAQNSTASSSISTNSVIDLSKLPPVLQSKVVQVTNKAALEAGQGRERSVKEAKKRFKETRKESVGQVHSQSEPSEVGPYQGRDPRRKNKLPGFWFGEVLTFEYCSKSWSLCSVPSSCIFVSFPDVRWLAEMICKVQTGEYQWKCQLEGSDYAGIKEICITSKSSGQNVNQVTMRLPLLQNQPN